MHVSSINDPRTATLDNISRIKSKHISFFLCVYDLSSTSFLGCSWRCSCRSSTFGGTARRGCAATGCTSPTTAACTSSSAAPSSHPLALHYAALHHFCVFIWNKSHPGSGCQTLHKSAHHLQLYITCAMNAKALRLSRINASNTLEKNLVKAPQGDMSIYECKRILYKPSSGSERVVA